MRKHVITILALALVGSSLGSAQTFEEEIRQEKLWFRQHQAGQQHEARAEVLQPQAMSFEEEVRMVKLEHRFSLSAQRYGARFVTKAEDVEQLKRDYRAFLSEQDRNRANLSRDTR